MTSSVINHLSINVLQTAKDTQAWAFRCATQIHTNPLVASLPCNFRFNSHFYTPLYFTSFTSFAPDDFIVVTNPLTFVWFRGTSFTNFGANFTHNLLVNP